MNMIRKTGGFTLVELIVVIAILAILAGVAVPAYSGYINSANEAGDNQRIEAVETAMAAALSMEGKDPSSVGSYFTATYASNKLTIGQGSATDVADVWANFKSFYGLASDATTAVINLDYYNATTEASTGNKIPALLDVLKVTG